MLKKHPSSILVILLAFLLTSFFSPPENEVDYKKGLPKKTSPGMLNFLHDYHTWNDPELMQKDGMRVYPDGPVSVRNRTMRYETIANKTIEDRYQELIQAKKPDVTLYKQIEKDDVKEKIAVPADWHLPEITLSGNRKLRIKTTHGVHVFDYTDGKEFKGDLKVEVLAVNEDAFFLEIEDEREDGKLAYLFAKQDFSKTALVERGLEHFKKAAADGKLEPFQSLFTPVGKGMKALRLSFTAHYFVTADNQWKEAARKDKLSPDGQYVYLDGWKDDLPDGVQCIQRTANYLTGSNHCAKEFLIDYDEIADNLDLASPGIGISHLYYFDGNMVIFSLQYHGYVVGTAGSTNAFVDLTKGGAHPPVYLADLDLFFPGGPVLTEEEK